MWIDHYDLVQKTFCDPILKRTLKAEFVERALIRRAGRGDSGHSSGKTDQWPLRLKHSSFRQARAEK